MGLVVPLPNTSEWGYRAVSHVHRLILHGDITIPGVYKIISHDDDDKVHMTHVQVINDSVIATFKES